MFPRPHPLLLVMLGLGLGGCVVDKGLSLSLETTGNTATIASTTVRVYRERCPTRQEMVFDQDTDLGIAYDQTGAPGTLPAIGELDPRTWSFAALGRGSDCAPLLFGCTDANVAEVDGVVITLDAETWEDPVCGPEVGCAMGTCTGPPATCDPATDPTGCGLPCDGADLTRDANHCGTCGHACPIDLVCNSSLCRPSPRPESIRLRLDTRSPTGLGDLTGLWVAIAWAPLDLMGGATLRVTEVTHAQPLDAVTAMDGLIVIRIAGIDAPVRARTALPDVGFFATAKIVLTRDTNGDGTIDVPDLPSPDSSDPPVEAYGVGDVALVWTDREVGREPITSGLAPEGLLRGLAAYGRAGEGYVPAAPDTIFPLLACVSSSGSTVDPACIASLPTPLQR